MSQLAVITAQSAALEPEPFQTTAIENLTKALLAQPSPPCLLRAPTGSGKTFMLARVLANVSAARPTVWFWFVPFVTLVQQTEDQLAANCPELSPVALRFGRNQEPKAGAVLLSTAQGVARARDRTKGFDADSDDQQRTLAEMIALTRAQGLAIGLVVDEAHIGLDKGTEFGKFAQWLDPNFLILASATPKDDRLNEFLAAAGREAVATFNVSRLEAVEARLNKRYIEAIVYDLRDNIAAIADLKRTVLRQAWLRHQWLKQQLQAAGVGLTPLLLVQVANGDKTVEETERDLIRLCKVPPGAIGKHSADAPDPVLMAAIANDSTKEVLIFKQSAGTGFDAPRAFVLASTKTVNDADFAMQFIGRVMRVAPPVRGAFPRPTPIPANLDTAYVYLADRTAQGGYATAVQSSNAVKSQLEGQVEKLEVRHTTSGAAVYTNRVTASPPLMYTMPEQPDHSARPVPMTEHESSGGDHFAESGTQASFLDMPLALNPEADQLDEMQAAAVTAPKQQVEPASAAEVVGALQSCGISSYCKRDDLPHVPHRLQRERRPELADMARVSREAAERFMLEDTLARRAVHAATENLRAREIHSELTEGKSRDEWAEVIMDRQALAREAITVLRRIPQVEDEDVQLIVSGLGARLAPIFAQESIAFAEAKDLERRARDAAFWVIRNQPDAIVELIQSLVAEFTVSEEGEPLPDAMVFPTGVHLPRSRKNIYGVMPPMKDDMVHIGGLLGIDQQDALRESHYTFGGQTWLQAGFDGTSAFNREELDFARSLDDADFVVWWHRNPDRKHYAVRLVRSDHENYFYPDFVVCIEHNPGAAPIQRLIETKDDTKDAARKARRVPRVYGKVLFVTRDHNTLRAINDDGSLGEAIDREHLAYVQRWMRATEPSVTSQ